MSDILGADAAPCVGQQRLAVIHLRHETLDATGDQATRLAMRRFSPNTLAIWIALAIRSLVTW